MKASRRPDTALTNRCGPRLSPPNGVLHRAATKGATHNIIAKTTNRAALPTIVSGAACFLIQGQTLRNTEAKQEDDHASTNDRHDTGGKINTIDLSPRQGTRNSLRPKPLLPY